MGVSRIFPSGKHLASAVPACNERNENAASGTPKWTERDSNLQTTPRHGTTNRHTDGGWAQQSLFTFTSDLAKINTSTLQFLLAENLLVEFLLSIKCQKKELPEKC